MSTNGGVPLAEKSVHTITEPPLNCRLYIYMQSVPLILGQTLRGGRGQEDKHYSVGKYGAQTSSVGVRGR